jgi:predicted nucleic acid-binding protein
MEMKVGFDTNIFLAVKNQETNYLACKKILDTIEKKETTNTNELIQAFLSVIVLAEILVGFYKKKEFEFAEKLEENIVHKYEVVPVSIEIAKNAALLRATSSLKLPDAILATTYNEKKVDVFISNDFQLNKKMSFKIMKPERFVEIYLNFNE